MKKEYTQREVNWFIIMVLLVILLFALEILWFNSMEVKKMEIRNCKPINYTIEKYIPKDYCSNVAEDVWICNLRLEEAKK